MSATAPLLRAEEVTVRFGGLVALDAVSFDIEESSIVGLIGPNGAGKSTMFNAITGIRPPTSGTVRLAGRDLRGAAPWRVARLGVGRTFQNIRLFPNLTVEQNVLVARHCNGSARLVPSLLGLPASRAERRADHLAAVEILDALGLGDRLGVRAGALPYADQRRLEIARALALQPRLLLLDEPAAGMNTAEKAGFVDFVRSLRDRFGVTICLIEHHVPLVMGVCDRIVVLDFGRAIADGAPADVRADPAVIEAYLGDAI